MRNLFIVLLLSRINFLLNDYILIFKLKLFNETKISNLIIGEISNFINNCTNECFDKQKK